MSQLTQQIHSSEIGDILENSLIGIRPKKDDYLRLLKSDDVYLLGLVAGIITQKKFGKKVSFVNNIILNYTNVCITDCKFCAFYRPPNHDEAYTLTLEEIEARVKTLYTGDIDSFKKVVESIPVPVVIAGGPKSKTDLDILQITEDAMDAGAKGVTYGRNIFAHKSPDKLVDALAGIIFRKESAKEMAKKIDK